MPKKPKRPKRKYASKNWGGRRVNAGRPPNAIKKLGLSEPAVAQVLFRAVDALTRDRDEKRAAKSAANRWKLTTVAPGASDALPDAPAGHADELQAECRQLLAGLTDSQLERLLANPEIKAAMDRYCSDDSDQVEQRIRELERELSPAATPEGPASLPEASRLPTEPEPPKAPAYSPEASGESYFNTELGVKLPIPKPDSGETLMQCATHGPYRARWEKLAPGKPPLMGWTICPQCKAQWDADNRKEAARFQSLMPATPEWSRRR
jgi:hypothetical protein